MIDEFEYKPPRDLLDASLKEADALMAKIKEQGTSFMILTFERDADGDMGVRSVGLALDDQLVLFIGALKLRVHRQSLEEQIAEIKLSLASSPSGAKH